MGSTCASCCDEDDVVLTTSRIIPVVEEQPTPQGIPTPTGFYERPVDADRCTCIAIGPDGDINLCPVDDEGDHWCRCTSSQECLAKVHHCVCKTGGSGLMCRRHMLSVGILSRLPSSCCVCLSLMSEIGEPHDEKFIVRLRVCGHCFHCGCLKTWLAKGRHFCPLCMRSVSSKLSSDVCKSWIGSFN